MSNFMNCFSCEITTHTGRVEAQALVYPTYQTRSILESDRHVSRIIARAVCAPISQGKYWIRSLGHLSVLLDIAVCLCLRSTS